MGKIVYIIMHTVRIHITHIHTCKHKFIPIKSRSQIFFIKDPVFLHKIKGDNLCRGFVQNERGIEVYGNYLSEF
jgi:hypothetical protein